MIEWYRDTIQDPGRAGLFWMLIAFVITFGITRLVTRRIRADATKTPAEQEAKRRGLGDIYIGGVHVHHAVWGILLILVSALLEFGYRPDSPWQEVLGALFGVGAALTLDEFALWFHLQDVYWAKEGRKSIDAVVVAVCLGGAVLLGYRPFGANDTAAHDGAIAVGVVVALDVVLSVFAALKGKLFTALVGVFVPIFSLVGAIRLAKPNSPWAHWRYRRRPKKTARAERRFGAERQQRLDRWRDRIGGGVGEEPPAREGDPSPRP